MGRKRKGEAEKYPIYGEWLTIADACRKYGKKYHTVKTRVIRHGYSLEEALTKPIARMKKGKPNAEWKKLSNKDRGYLLETMEW